MAQAWPKAKPKLTQDAFDEAVASNIEDFDMSRDEAIRSAVEEFNVQGYDLSGVVTNMAGNDLQSHPIAVACQGLRDACGGQGSLPEALEALSSSLQASTPESSGTAGGSVPSLSQEASIIAHKGGAMQALLEACRQLQNKTDELLKALKLLQVLLGWLETRDAFTEAKARTGVELLHDLLREGASIPEAKTAVATVAEAAARQVEEAKCRLVDSGTVATLLEQMQEPNAPLDFLGAACGVVRSVTTADDERPPASKAFMHARLLAKNHAAIRVLLGVLRRVPAAEEPGTACRVLGTVRQVAANEEICREFTDDGGVMACLHVLNFNDAHVLEVESGPTGLISDLLGFNKRYAPFRECAAQRDVCRACLGALRQLAHSDTVKKLLAEAGALDQAVHCVELHSGSDDVVEAALGLLGNMMLRQPEICAKAAVAGVADVVVEAMQRHAGRAHVQRQACLVTRIMVARNPELRPLFLERGAEALLRAAKAAHPASCRDVGSAALRDLGLDNYND
ncbi:hypothetical protein VOLCADRAFT_105247 [Volvox carteri f. nagariensis]|uniref:Armadillo repeat-containing protein 6 n=1 Tax=Volvox carteri f. nagariensis TaxID=3068 RepID=D8TZJ8_VOLCA|nr:uncharacterized protein VOLCADRAFT_105247 [Volvox carteri f. nagariensis]EFJ47195.1 hypothetical protein VOLCADRAFT_105247 [Volvox carteri f. nagariensis]|eukprot:XP_002951744.1 hypothetical protein VOLCADRAFT_105247 [Volvox carteri f. nagariensis]